jgi:flagellar basal body rod protein FlgF
MAEGEVKSADMSAGNITHTGRKLDVSMLGDAMMAVHRSMARKAIQGGAICRFRPRAF